MDLKGSGASDLIGARCLYHDQASSIIFWIAKLKYNQK